MFVVLDSNIWISQQGLNSARAAACRYFIKTKGATLAVPEAVKQEVESKVRESLRRHRASIESAHRQLLAHFGELREISLPSDEEIGAVATGLIAGTDVPMREMPLTVAAARSSFEKIVRKEPPSARQEQFADGVIWAHCLELLEESDVDLVSGDKAFFQDLDYRKGLAANLCEEVARCPGRLRLFSDLGGLLQEIREHVTVPDPVLVEGAIAGVGAAMDELLVEHGFMREGEASVRSEQFLTEQSTTLYVELEAQFRCRDVTPLKRGEGTLSVRARGMYDNTSDTLSNVQPVGIRLSYVDEEGERVARQAHYASAEPAVIGHRRVAHALRLGPEDY